MADDDKAMTPLEVLREETLEARRCINDHIEREYGPDRLLEAREWSARFDRVFDAFESRLKLLEDAIGSHAPIAGEPSVVDRLEQLESLTQDRPTEPAPPGVGGS